MTSYELPPYRPPSEARSLLIRATRGCPWHRCAFCRMYIETKFEVRSVEEVKQDIRAMKREADEIKEWACKRGYGDSVEDMAIANNILWLRQEGVKTAFIGDSNSIVMRTEELAEIIQFLYETFPTLERVTSYGRAKTVQRKGLEELERLRDAGLSRLHLGLETGDDELLRYINKGVTAAEMIEAGKKVVASGISLSEYIMLGLGGRERWEQHAQGTARALNEINPDFIRVRTLVMVPGTPLHRRYEQGEFELSSPEEILVEVKRLIESLEVTSNFVSDHISNYLELTGKLPQDKNLLLESIDNVLRLSPDHRPKVLQPEYLRHSEAYTINSR
ncbi:radical SAM protein [Chloroflexota bacterium]